ncbi:hypothetical protein FACS1894176_02890 [Bacteroidia bacterium]|nr:hypothetical protein FACS1894176_02890 [Bacteroidia bacterium]
MKKDPFKGAEYKYNYLNLPDEITVPAIMGKINYQYTTSGQKLKASYEWCPSYSLNPVENTGKPTNCTLSTKITDYVDNVIYENNNLKRILTDNGYIEGGVYYFYLKDHLGNNAVLANANGQSQQYNFYYPYGMTSQNESWNLNKQPYKFGGKEYETMHGLNLLDFVARPYDPVTGRFLTPDPLAEEYSWLSTYAYCGNNPVNAYDLHGDSIWYTRDQDNVTMHVTGKVINNSSDNINVGYDNWFSNNTRSAVHEFGHAAGLRHENANGLFNIMSQAGLGVHVTPELRRIMYKNQNLINRASNYEGWGQQKRPYSYYHPYVNGVRQTIPTYKVLNMGGR